MWGKEQGSIAINQGDEYGNVLPKSIRKFLFSWHADANLFNIGRYTAVATLTFGTSERKNVSQTISFWVVPVKETLFTLLALLGAGLLLFYSIRRYVRRAFQMELARTGASMPAASKNASLRMVAQTLSEPLREGVVDLRSLAGTAQVPAGSARKQGRPGVRALLRKYLLFFILTPLCILALLWLIFYFKELFFGARVYEIRLENPASSSSIIINGS
jgi:hypothetical protein